MENFHHISQRRSIHYGKVSCCPYHADFSNILSKCSRSAHRTKDVHTTHGISYKSVSWVLKLCMWRIYNKDKKIVEVVEIWTELMLKAKLTKIQSRGYDRLEVWFNVETRNAYRILWGNFIGSNQILNKREHIMAIS